MKSARKSARKLFILKTMELNRYNLLGYVYNINVVEHELVALRSLI